MSQEFVPGDFVLHPTQRDWGIGQVQSAVGNRLTVNFENRGKVAINGDVVALVPYASGDQREQYTQ